MGQGDVIQVIEELGFTTIDELQEVLSDFTRASITHALTALKKWNEIIVIEMPTRYVYLSIPFYEELQEVIIYE